MSNAFYDYLRLIMDGESIAEGTVNRVIAALDNNARYLKTLFETASFGSGIYLNEQTADDVVQVGQPVYYDVDGYWGLGVAGTVTDEDGVSTLAPSALVWGLVSKKVTSTKINILVGGYAELDMSAAISGTIVPGQYFLSGLTPGKLTLRSTGIPVVQVGPPGSAAGTHRVLVRTGFYDHISNHAHEKFNLLTTIAGSGALSDGIWQITSPNANVEGWLPANHSTFGSTAPQGAKFGYNIAKSAFAGLWPPMPQSAAYLEWDQGIDTSILGMGVPLGSDGLAIIDAAGIWWMSDCDGQVPWDTTATTTTAAP